MMGEPPKVLEHANERFSVYTGKASDAVRALGISGVGIAWLIAGGAQAVDPVATLKALRGQPTLAASLVLAMVVLLLDVVQFAWASFGWGVYSWTLGRIWQVRNQSWSEDSRAHWWLATAVGIDRLILGSVDYTSPRSERIERAAAALESADPSVLDRLKQPVSPKFINRGAGLFFWAKMLALMGAFGSLVFHVVGVLAAP